MRAGWSTVFPLTTAPLIYLGYENFLCITRSISRCCWGQRLNVRVRARGRDLDLERRDRKVKEHLADAQPRISSIRLCEVKLWPSETRESRLNGPIVVREEEKKRDPKK